MVSLIFSERYRWLLCFIIFNSVLSMTEGICRRMTSPCYPYERLYLEDRMCCEVRLHGSCRPISPCGENEQLDSHFPMFPRCCDRQSRVTDMRTHRLPTNREVEFRGRSMTPSISEQWEKAMDLIMLRFRPNYLTFLTTDTKPDFEAGQTVKIIAERPPGSPIGGKISFGFRSVPGGHPYLVSIRKIIGRGRNRFVGADGRVRSKHHCGGTLVHPNWIVSSAHCFLDARVPLRASDIVIRVGEYDLTVRDGPERDYNVREIITPNTFDRSTYETDISLLYIEGRGIQLRRGIIDLAELPTENIRVSPNDRCFVSGWGDTEQGPSTVVREAQLKYFNPGEQARCQNLYRSQREVTRSMFCAGTDDGVPRDTCLGDSGGPFICQINGRRMLIGITSWGVRECGRPFYPGVYTDVRVLRQWIRNNAGI